jgi:hypothetical protein
MPICSFGLDEADHLYSVPQSLSVFSQKTIRIPAFAGQTIRFANCGLSWTLVSQFGSSAYPSISFVSTQME